MVTLSDIRTAAMLKFVDGKSHSRWFAERLLQRTFGIRTEEAGGTLDALLRDGLLECTHKQPIRYAITPAGRAWLAEKEKHDDAQ